MEQLSQDEQERLADTLLGMCISERDKATLRATSIETIKRQFGCSLEEAEMIVDSIAGDGKLIEVGITLGGQLGPGETLEERQAHSRFTWHRCP